jgi:hypothetical protein
MASMNYFDSSRKNLTYILNGSQYQIIHEYLEVTGWRQITKVKVDSIFSGKIICQETIWEFLCLYAPQSFMLFVNGADDDTTICAFSRGCCEVSRTAVKAVCEGLSHLRKIWSFKT